MTLEDFTGYVEDDSNSRIIVTANKLDIDDCDEQDVAMVYKDKGVGHFGATFEHDFKVIPQLPAWDPGRWAAIPWAVSNAVLGQRPWSLIDSQAIYVQFIHDPTTRTRTIRLCEEEVPTYDATSNEFWTYGTPYYFTVERTSTTTIQARIYSDASRETLLDTLSILLPSDRTYRYIFGCNNQEMPGSTQTAHWDVEDLDLNEVPPPGIPVRAYRIIVRHQPGITLYALLFNAAGDCWDGEDFVPFTGEHPGFALSLDEIASRLYRTEIKRRFSPGTYIEEIWEQTGALPDRSQDILIALGEHFWSGGRDFPFHLISHGQGSGSGVKRYVHIARDQDGRAVGGAWIWACADAAGVRVRACGLTNDDGECPLWLDPGLVFIFCIAPGYSFANPVTVRIEL